MESIEQKSIMLWGLTNADEARRICITMFIAFWAIMTLGQLISSVFNHGLDSIFFLIGGFSLGVSEVMYYVSKGLMQ